MAEIRASHILVKHQDSRNPASWKDREGKEIKARTRDQAASILEGLRQQIRCKEKSFSDVARTYSDCSSAQNGGDLGPFGRGVMQKTFEDAAFSLQVGEISGIVDSASGCHIIKRTA